jgi:hypothetical protein
MKKTLLLSIAALVCGMALAASPQTAPPAPTATPKNVTEVPAVIAKLSLPDLEKAFWACEGGAKSGLVDMGSAADCSIVYEQVKERKFKGNFNTFMVWWKAEKVKQH